MCVFLFAYGSFTDAEYLQWRLCLTKPPVLKPATITGWRLKINKHFPALVPDEDSHSLEGRVVELQNEAQLRTLTKHEGAKYELVECDIKPRPWQEGDLYQIRDGVMIKGAWKEGDEKKTLRGKVFVWAGQSDSHELKEGEFEWDMWLLQKGRIMGKKEAKGAP